MLRQVWLADASNRLMKQIPTAVQRHQSNSVFHHSRDKVCLPASAESAYPRVQTFWRLQLRARTIAPTLDLEFACRKFRAKHAGQGALSLSRFFHKCLGRAEVRCIQTLREPPVNGGKKTSRFGHPTVVPPKSRQTHGGTQLERLRTLAMCNVERGLQVRLDLV